MTYTEFISQFQVFENPPSKKGYHRHHIVPECEQKKLYGEVTDQRQVYLSIPQHMWAHILYDREHNTKTSWRLLTICGKTADYFDCFEKCLECSETMSKKKEEQLNKLTEVRKTTEYRQKLSKANKGKRKTEEHKRKIAESKKGKSTFNKGLHCYTNGIIDIYSTLCPEGFVRGSHSHSTTGYHWINNGIVQKTWKGETPEGWFVGRLKIERRATN